MLAEMHTEALVLGANKYGTDDIARHEQKEEAIMQVMVVEDVEDRKKDQAAGSCCGEDDCGNRLVW